MKIIRHTKGNWDKVKMFFDLQTSEGFTIKGFKLIEGEDGFFVGAPSKKKPDDSYDSIVWMEKDIYGKLIELAKETLNSEDTPKQQIENPKMVEEEELPF